MARLADFDKATTRRLLVSLMRAGLVEQNSDTRKYRLGAAILRLAHVREETFPVASVVKPVLQGLTQATGETSHFSLLTEQSLQTTEIENSSKTISVNVDYSQPLPLHCTASGIAVLSYQSAEKVRRVLGRRLKVFTENTVVDPEQIRKNLAAARSQGYGYVDSGFESGVCGLAAAVFDSSGYACGAVAVATPVSRMHEKQFELTRQAVRRAAIEITRAFGAQPDREFMSAA